MSSPILIWTPEGGTPAGEGPVAPGPLPGTGITNAGLTQLVNGQSYIDVIFDQVQVDNTWIFVECSVVNTTDSTPLNIWAGIITSKLTTGFRLQLNGLPDSNNYFLNWAVSGVNIPPPAPFPATTYTLIGPTSGIISTPSSNFTVKLPLGATVSALVVVTPSDSGIGGTFTPPTATLTTAAPSATFTYTPSTYGGRPISVTNNGGLTDPVNITYTSLTSTYTLSGPSSGSVGTASTNFTVALPTLGAVIGSVTVTPSDSGGGGTFTPTTMNLSTGAPSATFTYTPASTGTKTISVTNNGGLTDPGSISYVVTAPFDPTTITGLRLWLKADAITVGDGGTDGSTVTTWRDQSGVGNNFTNVSNPTFKTNIINSKPVVRFNGTAAGMTSPSGIIPSPTAYTVFVVASAASISAGSHSLVSVNNGATAALILRRDVAVLNQYQYNGSSYINNSETGGIVAGAWNYITADWDGTNIHLWRNGTLKGTAVIAVFTPSVSICVLGYDNISISQFFDGDIAEVLIYNSALSPTDRGNCENYLKTKYGL